MSVISELEMRILAVLEEFGVENIPTLINTVTETSGEDAERVQLQEALLDLVREDFIKVTAGRNADHLYDVLSKEDSKAVISNIADHLFFDAERRCWTGGSRPWPEIASTDAGREKASEVLDERGYQWWLRSG